MALKLPAQTTYDTFLASLHWIYHQESTPKRSDSCQWHKKEALLKSDWNQAPKAVSQCGWILKLSQAFLEKQHAMTQKNWRRNDHRDVWSSPSALGLYSGLTCWPLRGTSLFCRGPPVFTSYQCLNSTTNQIYIWSVDTDMEIGTGTNPDEDLPAENSLLSFWRVSQKMTGHFICKVKCKFHRNGSEYCWHEHAVVSIWKVW